MTYLSNDLYVQGRWERIVSERTIREIVTRTTIIDGRESTEETDVERRVVVFETDYAQAVMRHKGRGVKEFSTYFGPGCIGLAINEAENRAKIYEVDESGPLTIEVDFWTERVECAEDHRTKPFSKYDDGIRYKRTRPYNSVESKHTAVWRFGVGKLAEPGGE